MKKFNQICIIDDDPIFVFGAKKILESKNFSDHFLVYKNGKEALLGLTNSYYQEQKIPDLIILDINMPIMDGWSFLENFSRLEFSQTVRIYMASSSVDSRDLDKAAENKMVTDYILKPINYKSFDKIKEAYLV